MEMQQIRYFLALATTLNFTRAAEQCHVSQPALTRAIRGLEAEFGGDLIRREGRLSHLTELGQRLLPMLQQCYDGAASAQSLARGVSTGAVAVLAIGVSRSVSVELIMDCVAELCSAFPALQLNIRRGAAAEIVEMLKQGDVELAVAGPLGTDWDRLDAWTLFSEEFELVVGADHALAGRNDDSVDCETIRGERFLVQVGGEMADQQLDRLRAAGVAVAHPHEVESDRDMTALLEANLGIAIAPESAPRSDRLRRLRLTAFDLQRTVRVYAAAGRRRTVEAGTLLGLLRAADWRAKLD
jgi:DNA-binding transcriptional LysR family regulator